MSDVKSHMFVIDVINNYNVYHQVVSTFNNDQFLQYYSALFILKGNNDDTCIDDVNYRHGEYISINATCSGCEANSSCSINRLLQIYFIHSPLVKNVNQSAFVHPVLLHNLSLQKKCCDWSVISCWKLTNRKIVQLNSTMVTDTDIYLKLVASPHYKSGWDFSSSISTFFNEYKQIVLTTGDVLPIPLNIYDMKKLTATTSSLFRCLKYIYFKVKLFNRKNKQCIEESVILDVDKCMIHQDGGIVSTYIPTIDQSNLVVHGYEQFSNNLQSMFHHFLNKWESSYPHVPTLLVYGKEGSGKSTVIRLVAARYGLHCIVAPAEDIIQATPKATEAKISYLFADCVKPSVIVLQHIDFLIKNKEGRGFDYRLIDFLTEKIQNLRSDLNADKHLPLIVVGTSLGLDTMEETFLSNFLIDLEFPLMSEDQRKEFLKNQLADLSEEVLSEVATRTVSFCLNELYSLVRKCKFLLFNDSSTLDESLLKCVDVTLASRAKMLGAPEIPVVDWEDIGGLEDVVDEVRTMLNQELESKNDRFRSTGILLYGCPGVGKTLLAKAVASQFSYNFLSVKGPELINMYVGESEANIRHLFQKAKTAAPSIVFFDELDSLAPHRGQSGGVLDRIVSQILTELDSLPSNEATVFVIGATNRPDLLDSALLRPGRFDRLVYIGPAKTISSKVDLLRAQLRHYPISDQLDLNKVVGELPGHVTGADVLSMVQSASSMVIERAVEKETQSTIDEEVVLTTELLVDCARELQSSVSEVELIEFEKLRGQFSVSSSTISQMSAI